MTAEPKVCREQAELEFEQWAENMDLELDDPTMSDESKDDLQKHRGLIIRAIMGGHLTFSPETGLAVFTPKNAPDHKPITFHQHSGQGITETDKKKEGHNAAKQFAMMGVMCKCPPCTFSNLIGFDIKVCTALFLLLFMG